MPPSTASLPPSPACRRSRQRDIQPAETGERPCAPPFPRFSDLSALDFIRPSGLCPPSAKQARSTMPVTTRLATASPAPSSVASSQDVALSSTFDDTSTPTRRLTRSAARLLSPAALPAPGTPKFAAPPSPPSGQRARSRSQSPATSVTGKSTPRAAARATRSASRLSVEVESTSASGGSRRGSIPPTTPAAADKGKAREVVVEEVESEDEDDSSEASSSSSSSSESESEEDSDDDEGLDKFAPARTEVEEEAFLAGLLSQAYASAEAKAAEKKAAAGGGVLLEMESTKEV